MTTKKEERMSCSSLLEGRVFVGEMIRANVSLVSDKDEAKDRGKKTSNGEQQALKSFEERKGDS